MSNKVILMPGSYAIAVARVSTTSEKQPSVPHQVTMAGKVATSHGLAIPDDGVYVDEMSRSLWPRPGVSEALVRSRDPRCAMIIVWEGSRMWGDARQQLDIFEALETTRTLLFNAKGEHLNDSNEVVEFTQGIDSLLSRLETRRLSRRVHETHIERFEKGVFIQKPPYGFRYDVEQQTVVPVEEQLENLRMAWRWLAIEGITMYEVCARWRRMGIKTKGGYRKNGVMVLPTEWSEGNLNRTLTNRLYIGEMIWNRTKTTKLGGRRRTIKRPEEEWKRAPTPWGNVVAQPHDCTKDCPICEQAFELFERASATIRFRAGQHSRPRNPNNIRLFGNLVHCGTCGRRMYPRKDCPTKDRPNRRTYTFYCKRDHRCTRRPTIGENTLLRMFAGLIEGPTVVRGWSANVALQSNENSRTSMKSIRNYIDKCQAERSNYLRLRAQEIISSDAQLREYLDEVDSRLRSAQQELAALATQPLAEQTVRLDEVLSTVQNIVPTLTDSSIPIEERQALLQRYVTRIIVDKPKVVFEITDVT